MVTLIVSMFPSVAQAVYITHGGFGATNRAPKHQDTKGVSLMNYLREGMTVTIFAALEAYLVRVGAFLAYSGVPQGVWHKLLPVASGVIWFMWALPALITGIVAGKWLGRRPIRNAVLIGVTAYVMMLVLGWISYTTFVSSQEGRSIPADWRKMLGFTVPLALSRVLALVVGTSGGLLVGRMLPKIRK